MGSTATAKRSPTLPHFSGFSPKALRFFSDLANNQNKEWFAAHKSDYEHFVRLPLQSFVADLSTALALAGSPLRGDPQKSLFRINRDVRFSKDKHPYNTHASAALTRDGERHSPGVLYFHLDPAGSFAAAGFFRPEPAVLQQMRLKLNEDIERWTSIEKALEKDGFPVASDDMLVRLPKGFEDAPAAASNALKRKSWIVRIDLTEEHLQSPVLVQDVAGLAHAAAPLLDFGWSALT